MGFYSIKSGNSISDNLDFYIFQVGGGGVDMPLNPPTGSKGMRMIMMMMTMMMMKAIKCYHFTIWPRLAHAQIVATKNK